MSNYRKTMTEALREMYPLDESVIDKVKEIASKKQAKKIGGVMVDSFTASAISQIYDKVNDANKKKMEKLPITKLANLAFKMMQKNEFVPEEVDLDETQLDEGTIDKVKEIASKKQAKKIDGVMVDSFTASAISQIYDKVNDANKKKMEKLPITKLANLAFKMMQKNDYVPEEVDLDEGTKQVLAHGGKGQYKAVRDGSITKVMYKGKVVGTADFDRGADSFFASIKGEKGQKSFDDAQAMVDYFAKNKITEEVDLDEADDFKPHMMYDPKTGKGYKADTMDDHLRMKKMGYTHDAPKTEEVDLDEAVKHMEVPPDGPRGRGVPMAHPERIGYDSKENQQAYNSTTHGTPDNQIDTAKHFMKKGLKGKKLHKAVADHHDVIHVDVHKQLNHDKKKLHPLHMSFVGEDLDEGKMSQLHQYIKDKKSPEQIAKLMKLDVKTVKALMNSHHPEEVEESAASDARRAMRRDKDFSRRDSADDDTDATADDVKGASKNIMMQMRKAQSLNGRFDVEFADGKKVKIPAKMAIAVQSKYNKMRRPAEKEKFQAKVGKSYRDMLSALKEAVSPAQQAAIAISKKERGEKPKKESVLDRIDRKIKEKNDG